MPRYPEVSGPRRPPRPPRPPRPLRTDDFRIRSLFWTVYLPTFLLSVGQGLVIVQVPLLAKDLGAGFGLIGVAVAAREIGTMMMDVPSGFMVSKFGSKRTMVAGTAAIGAAAIGAGFAQSVALFIVMRLAQGGFTA
ncbi:MAG: MFS transporter, partial [Chloroflexi bacterium]|nr:MFS transporter [Chloroflexota bacterium]